MPNYIIAYRGGNQPETPEAGKESFAQWQTWVANLGDAAVNPGTPLKGSQIVSSDGVSTDGGDSLMIGFTVVSADTMDAAIEMAQACPHLGIGGTLQVAEMIEM
jgi:hypothetical protein